jgi:hypothetical protein
MARHVAAPDFSKCRASPDIEPLIFAGAFPDESVSVSRTIAPGAGAAGEMRSVGVCAATGEDAATKNANVSIECFMCPN